jgi:hypothetical protein
VDPALEALWAKVLEDWPNEERHRALLDHARHQGKLADVAALYRAVACSDDDAEERAELAKKKLSNIVTLAVLELESSRAVVETERPKRIITWVAFFALLGILVLVGWGLRSG